MINRFGPELETLIGEEGIVRLAEAFGGTRLFIPATMSSAHDIAKAIGIEAATKLSKRFAPDVISVPLAREARARHYRAAGRSNAQIARALGISVSGVERLFFRARERGPDDQFLRNWQRPTGGRPRRGPRRLTDDQLGLFDD